MADYSPIVLDVEMSKYGYWVVTVSVAPGKRVSTMVAKTGVTREEAIEHVFESMGQILSQKGWQ